jgi:hypothetical protein
MHVITSTCDTAHLAIVKQFHIPNKKEPFYVGPDNKEDYQRVTCMRERP